MKVIEYTKIEMGGLRVVTDIGVMYIGLEQRLYLSHGLVFCGPNMAAILPVIEIPDGGPEGIAATTLRGFTDDPNIVQLYQKYVRKRKD